MHFRDRITVRLADPATRSALFDEMSLNQILDAGYDTSTTPVNAPFNAVFDEFLLGYAEVGNARGEGRLYGVSGELGRIALTITDWHPDPGLRADALWRGAVVARSAPEEDLIESLDLKWADLAGIDAAVAAAHGGALPADAGALEAARRDQLVQLIQAELQSPEALTDARVSRLLGDMGVASASELVTAGTARPATLGVTFSAPAGLPPSPQRYPITAALLIRDQGFGLTELLEQSKLLRSRLEASGVDGPRPQKLPIRQRLLVVWLVPITVFDDDDWPGASAGMGQAARRTARRQRAGQWLAREGIGLAVVSD
ncbi:MAG: hypothetical protein JJT90_12210 [Ectothiorhodospiraceae bacterium]|nr:hypothetical protein [Ectothiorhodospiraceae bacterium]